MMTNRRVTYDSTKTMHWTTLRRSGSSSAVLLATVLAVGILSFVAPAEAQDAPREVIARDIDQILKTIQGPGADASLSEQGELQAPHLLKRKDGYLRVLVAPPAKYFPISLMIRTDPLATAKDFIEEHKAAFGLQDELFGLVPKAIKAAAKGSHVRLDQTYAGIPVFGAQIVVQLNEEGNLEYISCDAMTEDEAPDVEGDWAAPPVTQIDAGNVALGTLMAENPGMQFHTEPATLMIYQPSVVGNTGPGHVVWHTKIISMPDPWVGERVLVDAQNGEIALRCTLVRNFLDREIYDARNSLVSILRRTDGTPPYLPVPDVDSAYDGLEYAYNVYRDVHGRDGVDNTGSLLKAFVRICYPKESCPWRNIGWIAEGYNCFFLGEGFPVDDIIAHEFAHGITEYETGLLYMNESGAIDESLADIGGEWVDQANGAGNDSDEVKWLIGEDLPGGAVRDMNHPAAPPYYQADRKKSENWRSLPSSVLPSAANDYGYVHNNCGVGNKLCCLLTDGGTFNGCRIDPTETNKVESLYYEVQTHHLLPCAADYNDLYFALVRAADNMEWTAAERLNLEHACRAVEIATGREDSSTGAPADTHDQAKTASVLFAADVKPTERSNVQPTNKGEPRITDSPARRSSHVSSQTMPDREDQPDAQHWQANATKPRLPSAGTETTALNSPWRTTREDPIAKPASARQTRINIQTPQPVAREGTDATDALDAASSRNVAETLRLQGWVFPSAMSRSERVSPYAIVLIRLPGTPQEQADEMDRTALYPEGIKAAAQTTNHFESQDGSGISIWAAFDMETLLGTILENGHTMLRITGTLSPAQRFEAVSEVDVTP